MTSPSQESYDFCFAYRRSELQNTKMFALHLDQPRNVQYIGITMTVEPTDADDAQSCCLTA